MVPIDIDHPCFKRATLSMPKVNFTAVNFLRHIIRLSDLEMLLNLFSCHHQCLSNKGFSFYDALSKFSNIHCILWGPKGFGDLGRMAIYFQGAGEH